MVAVETQKSNGNGFNRIIMAGLFSGLILASFGWTTVVFFDLSKKLDNHLFHIQASLDSISAKVGKNGERLSSIEGRLRQK